MIFDILKTIGAGMLLREKEGSRARTTSASEYIDELVAERLSLDEYMRTTKVAGKTKTPSYAAKSISPESGIMAYRRAVEKMRS